MAKRTNRMAWGLVAVLAFTVLSGIAGLYAPHAVSLRRLEWGFGPGLIVIGDETVPGWGILHVAKVFKLGPVAIRHPLAPRAWTCNGTGR